MRESAVLVEVVVGELQLMAPQHSLNTAPPTLSPIVAIQIHSAPVLCIPFLNAERIQEHQKQSHGGHTCLPWEVEESYRNGGRFVFQQGKSCLFTVPEETWRLWQESNWQGVKVALLNDLHSPPSLYGSCKARLDAGHGGEVSKGLKGKVKVLNVREEVLAEITLSVSCQNLGEDVARHTQALSRGDGVKGREWSMEGSVHILESVALNGQLSWQTVLSQNNCSQCKDKRDDSLLNTAVDRKDNVGQQHTESDDHENHTRLECASRLDPSPLTSASSVGNGLEHNSSDLIHNSKDEESFSKKSSPDEHASKETDLVKQDTPKNSSKMHHTSKRNHVESPKISDEGSRKSSYDSCSSYSSHKNAKTNKKIEVLRKPTGWLRSSPVASSPIKTPQPKLNRAHLLRRANLDPQLARQLQAEVDLTVKHRLKQIDDQLQSRLEIMVSKKARKLCQSKSQTIGCQTAEIWRDDVSEIISRSSRSLVSNGNKQFKNIEIDIESPRTPQFHNGKEAHEMKSTIVLGSNGRSKPKELARNLTFEIDVTGREESEGCEDDFIISSDTHNSRSTSERAENHSTGKSSTSVMPATVKTSATYSSPLSESSSKSTSEPKKRRSKHSDTNRTRDASLRDREKKGIRLTRSDMAMREPSQDTGLTYTVYEDNSDGLQTSPKILSEDHSEDSKFLSAESDIKVSSSSSHRSHKSNRKNKDQPSSRNSKVSEISAAVYREILKGKQADFLSRAGSKLLINQEHSITPEQVVSVPGSYLSCTEGSINEEVHEVEDISEVDHGTARSSIVSDVQSDYEGCGSSLLSSYSQLEESVPIKTNISSSFPVTSDIPFTNQELPPQNIGVLKSLSFSVSEKLSLQSHDMLTSTEAEKEKKERDEDRVGAGKNRVGPEIGRSEEDSWRSGRNITKAGEDRNIVKIGNHGGNSSISDISARIAALLVPRKVNLATMNTDSVSSYVPSNLNDTMSSLSDMTQD